MSDAVMTEMRFIVCEAMELCPGRSVKERIAFAARQLRTDFSRTRGIYYREARAILAHEADALRAWYRDHTEQEADRLEQRARVLRERGAALRKSLDGNDLAMARAGEFRRG